MNERLNEERLEALYWEFDRRKYNSAVIGGPTAISDRHAFKSVMRTFANETRAEILKDHFKIGEEVLAGAIKPISCTVVAQPHIGGSPYIVGDTVRRPLKMRPMTRQEKIQKLWDRLVHPEGQQPNFDKMKDSTIDDLCDVEGISTETPTE